MMIYMTMRGQRVPDLLLSQPNEVFKIKRRNG